MNSEQNRQLIRSTYEAVASGDLRAAFDNMRDEVVWIAPETSPMARALGTTNRLNGKQQVMDVMFSGLPKVFPTGLEIQVRSVYGDGDTVIAEVVNRGRLATGRLYQNEYCFLFEIVDGKIKLVREYLDTHKLHQLLFSEEVDHAGEHAVARYYEEVWHGGNLAVLDELFAPSFIGHDPNFSGDFDLQGLRNLVISTRDAMPDLKITSREVIVHRGVVIVRYVTSATFSGKLMGFSPTGKELSWTGMVLYRFRGDKISELWNYWDSKVLMNELGGPPASPTHGK